MKLLALLLFLVLPACHIGPAVTLSGGDKVWLGASFLENSTSESASFPLPGGGVVTYSLRGVNQTDGAAQIAGAVSSAAVDAAAKKLP